jgi:hypothetical protein
VNSGKSTVFFVEFVSKYNISLTLDAALYGSLFSKGFIPAVSRSSGSTKVYLIPKFLQTLIILSILSLSGDTYVIPKFFALPWLVILFT